MILWWREHLLYLHQKFAKSDFCQINSVFTSQWAISCFFFLFLWIFASNWAKQFIAKGEFYIAKIQKLSLTFSHCLCGCWFKGIIDDPIRYWLEWSWCASLNSIKDGLLSHFSNTTITYEKFEKLNGREQFSRQVFSRLGPGLEELGITEIPLQSQLYPLNRRVDLTQDRRHLDLAEVLVLWVATFKWNELQTT